MSVRSSEVIELVEHWGPILIKYGAIVFAVALVLRFLLALFQKRSTLLRAATWLGGIACVGGIAAMWLVTGKMPDLKNMFSGLWTEISGHWPDRINDANRPSIIVLAIGGAFTVFAGPLAFLLTGAKDRESSRDTEIVFRTVGLLAVIVGTLMALGVVSFKL